MKLTKKKINETMKQLAELKRQQDELSIKIDELQETLKNHMLESDIETLIGKEHKAIYKLIVTPRIDLKSLKTAHPKIAKEFTIETAYMRFIFQ